MNYTYEQVIKLKAPNLIDFNAIKLPTACEYAAVSLSQFQQIARLSHNIVFTVEELNILETVLVTYYSSNKTRSKSLLDYILNYKKENPHVSVGRLVDFVLASNLILE